jgi:DNA primase
VPLEELFAPYNPVYARGDGKVECGHEPFHGSKSGRCVLIDTAAGRWWCRSCCQSGDAAAFIMATKGWTYVQAAQWLEERYGPPRRARSQRCKRRRGSIAWRTL